MAHVFNEGPKERSCVLSPVQAPSKTSRKALIRQQPATMGRECRSTDAHVRRAQRLFFLQVRSCQPIILCMNNQWHVVLQSCSISFRLSVILAGKELPRPGIHPGTLLLGKSRQWDSAPPLTSQPCSALQFFHSVLRFAQSQVYLHVCITTQSLHVSRLLGILKHTHITWPSRDCPPGVRLSKTLLPHKVGSSSFCLKKHH